MSYIGKILKNKYLSKVETVKDMVYKSKKLKPEEINEQLEKLEEQSLAWSSGLHYSNYKYFYTLDNFNQLRIISSLHANLSNRISEFNDPNETLKKFLISEIQNSLWVEGVRSSKKKIKQLIKQEAYEQNNKKDFSMKISSNFLEAINFVLRTDEIEENTLFALYTILTKGIDMKAEKLDGFPYRQDEVQIGDETNPGISPSLIKESMDSIFDLAQTINITEDAIVKNVDDSLLIHYHFELIHPYYDMNGRMGRLLSLWYAKQTRTIEHLLFFSEAVNHFKYELYYPAFKKSNFNGYKLEASYFVASMHIILIAHKITYLVLKDIEANIKNKYQKSLGSLEKDIILQLLSKDKDTFYLKEDLILGVDEINPAQVSKAFNNLEAYGLLKVVRSKPNEYSLMWSEQILESFEKLLNLE